MKKRKGFQEARRDLKPFGLRPARLSQCSKIYGTAGYIALPFIRDLRDDNATPDRIIMRRDNLGDLVDGIIAISQGNRNYFREVRSKQFSPVVGDSGRIDVTAPSASVPTTTDREVSNGTSAPAAPAEPTAQPAQAARPSDTFTDNPRMKALLEILDKPSVSEEDVARIVQKVAQTSIADAVQGSMKAVADRVVEIDRKILDAVKQASAAIPIRFEICVPDREAFVVEGEHNMFPTLCQEVSLGHPVLLCGPAGSGKTTGAERVGEKLGLKTFIMPPVADRFELLGFIDAAGNYQPSPAYRWATCEEPALLILDEIDRSHAGALTSVHAMLANGLAVFPHEQRRIPEGHRIIATANTWGVGPDAEYTGSARLDAATLNRFVTRMDWDYDAGLETRIAVANGGDGTEAAWCQQMRAEIRRRGLRIIWGPRDTVAHCRRVAAGAPRRESLNRSVLATVPEETRRELANI